MPKLSIVMPVYNTSAYVGEAIKSIINQTFTDFELIIIDDQSTDNSVDIIRTFKDERIRLFINETNLGRAGTDNKAIEYVRGEYVAKVDSDDVNAPDRFEKQISELESNPTVNIVGCFMKDFGESTFLHTYPKDPAYAKCLTLFSTPVGNASAVFRSDLFLEKGLRYDTALRQSEDYDLYARYIDLLSITTLQEPLYFYRIFNLKDKDKQNILQIRRKAADDIRKNLLLKVGFQFDDKELNVHNAIANKNLKLYGVSLEEAHAWLVKLASQNDTIRFFRAESLREMLADQWFHLCYLNPQKLMRSFRAYHKSVFSRTKSLNVKVKFFAKGILNIL